MHILISVNILMEKNMRDIKNKFKRYLRNMAIDKTPKLYPALKNTKEGNLYGYIDETGKMIIEPKFTTAYDFNNWGFAVIEENNKWGLINTKGEYKIMPIYDYISDFIEKTASFNKEEIMGAIDEKGDIITKRNYNFVGNFNEGRAIVGLPTKNGDSKYGYIDADGNERVKIELILANDFNEGVAIVKFNEDEYSLIDKEGNIINNYKYSFVSQYGDGLMVFQNKEGLYGFIDKDGNEVIKPIYKTANGFVDGLAVVSEEGEFNGPFGAINKQGKYVYKPIFSDIRQLGEERVALGMGIGKDDNIKRNIYAIGDTKGNKLTDFLYLDVGNYKDGLAYASDEENTFFINSLGEKDIRLPIVSGSGQLIIKDNLIYADIDYSPYYLDKNKKIIYKPNDLIELDKQYSVLKFKYKPNINYLIYVPVIKGVKNKEVQNNINKKLKEMSLFIPINDEKQTKELIINKDDVLNYDYFGDFSIKYFNKDLLVLNLTGYYYLLGAAHGMPILKTPSINLITGEFYNLSDLFIPSIYWVSDINKIIKEMIDKDKKYEYVFKDTFKTVRFDQGFYIDKENLYIYFSPYEIGPYSAGFITFKIPFSKIDNIINKKGSFYKSFN